MAMGQQRVARGKAMRPVVVLLVAVLLCGCGINTIPTEEEQAKAAWSEVQS
jgi:LemA protein